MPQKLNSKADLSVNEGSERTSFLRKVFSSNWWWYGQVNPDPKKLPAPEARPRLWRNYLWTGIIAWAVLLFFPTTSSLLNYEIPDERDFLTLRGEVVETSLRSPHMNIKLNDGHILKAEFPVQINLLRGVTTELFKEPVHKLVLTCKNIVVSGVYLRYLPVDRFRIWDFSCENGAFFVPKSEIKKKWLAGRLGMHLYIVGLCWIFLPLFLFTYYLKERKNYVFKN